SANFTDRKVRGSNPLSPPSRLPLSSLGQPGSIQAFVPPSCGLAARHRKDATAEQFIMYLSGGIYNSGTTHEETLTNLARCVSMQPQSLAKPDSNDQQDKPATIMRHLSYPNASSHKIVPMNQATLDSTGVQSTYGPQLPSSLDQQPNVPSADQLTNSLNRLQAYSDQLHSFLSGTSTENLMAVQTRGAPTKYGNAITVVTGNAARSPLGMAPSTGSFPPIVSSATPAYSAGSSACYYNLPVPFDTGSPTVQLANTPTSSNMTLTGVEANLLQQLTSHLSGGTYRNEAPPPPAPTSVYSFHMKFAYPLTHQLARDINERGRDGSSGWSANLLTGKSVVRTRPLPLNFPCLSLGNLGCFQPLCFLRVGWRLGTGRLYDLSK
ncbi:hypothetical protein T265_13895, partial [Opisthorchis viverrini]